MSTDNPSVSFQDLPAPTDEDIGNKFMNVFSAMDNDLSNLELNHLAFNAMQDARAPKERCPVCNGIHVADRCYARGPNFQPPQVSKNVQQWNLKHGDKPSTPIPDRPPTPRTASFALQQRTMSLPHNDDCTITSDTMPLTFNSMTVPSNPTSADNDHCDDPFTITSTDDELDATALKLKSMYTSSAVDATLTKLAAELDDQIDNNSLTIDPKFAMIDFASSSDPPGKPTLPSTDAHHDLANPLQISDYDVYGQ